MKILHLSQATFHLLASNFQQSFQRKGVRRLHQISTVTGQHCHPFAIGFITVSAQRIHTVVGPQHKTKVEF